MNMEQRVQQSAAIKLGPFDLLEPIGQGATGEVWRALHRDQGLDVAVKVLRGGAAMTTRHWRAFRNEVQAVASLSHPGVIMLLDYGDVSAEESARSEGRLLAGSPFLVMEQVSGGTLGRITGPLQWRAVYAVLMALLDALAHAHARGVIHRDLKPANVLLPGPDDARLGLKLTDFGIAHALRQDESADENQSIVGTPAYMAPEQFEGGWRDHGPWTDLYALGCLAWKLVTGEPPFGRGNLFSLAYRHGNEAPPELQPMAPVPSGFEAWVRRLLVKEPGRRFECAADAAWALRKLGSAAEAEAPGEASSAVHALGLPLERNRWVIQQAETVTGTLLATDESTAEALRLAAQRQIVPTGDGAVTPMKRLPPPWVADWRRPVPPETPMKLVGAGLGLYGLRMVPLVGRHQERDRVWEALGQAKAEVQPRAVLMTGAAGVGKSRLVEWICERAHEVGAATILKATHDVTPQSTSGLSGMLARWLRCAGMERAALMERAKLLSKRLGLEGDYTWQALGQLMSPVGEDEDALVRFGSAAERYALVCRLLGVLGRPVVLWLDDVQWGSDTLAFVEHLLGARGHNVPVLVLMTVRDEALSQRPVERALIERLMTRPQVALEALEPLGEEGSAALVEELLVLDGDLAAQVQSRSGGNPLFAVQLIGDWVARGVLKLEESGFVLESGEEAPLPDDVHQIWKARIDRLMSEHPLEAREALELAAVLGQEADFGEWMMACDARRVSLEQDLLDEMLDQRLIQATERGWRFVHGMLRESIERGAREAGRWKVLHSTCASALTVCHDVRAQGVSERIGAHLLEAGELEEAFEPLMQGARDRRQLYQFKEAEALLARCEKLLESLAVSEGDVRWGKVWQAQSLVWRRQSRFEQAAEACQRIAKAAASHGWAWLLPDALRLQGEIARQRGDVATAQDLLEQARRGFEGIGGDHGLARTLTALAAVAQQRGELDVAVKLLERSQRLGDSANAARCWLQLGHVNRRQGEVSRAIGFYQRAYGATERMGNRLAMANILNGLGEVERYRGNFARAEGYYRRAVTLCDELGHGEHVIPRLNLGLLLLRRGQAQEARVLLMAGHDVLARRGQRGPLGGIQVALVACAACLEDWDGWEHHMLQARQALEQTAFVDPDVAWSATIAGRRALEAGHQQRAAAALSLALEQRKALGHQQEIEELETLLETVG